MRLEDRRLMENVNSLHPQGCRNKGELLPEEPEERCLCVWRLYLFWCFLQMHLRFGFVFGHLHKTRGRTSLKRLALQSGKQRLLIVLSGNSLGRRQFPRQRQDAVCACTGAAVQK